MNSSYLIRRFAAVTAVALSLAIFAPVGVSLASAAGCSFSYGFAALDTVIPNQVGGCLGDPSILSNGNTVQQTATGLLAYNPADNVPEFTDGTTTWALGPQGLQTRPNDQRFSYEAAQSQVAGVFITHQPDTRIVACMLAMINAEATTHITSGFFPLPTPDHC